MGLFDSIGNVANQVVNASTFGAYNPANGGGWLTEGLGLKGKDVPPNDYIGKLGTLGAYYGNLGKDNYNFYDPAMKGQVQSFMDIMNGRYNPAADAARAGFIDKNNALYDTSADRIKQIWSGFGRSGNPLAAKSLAENEIGRMGAVSGFNRDQQINAADKLSALLQGGLNMSSGYGAMGGNFTANAGNLQAGQNASQVQAANAPAQNLLNLLGSVGHAAGGAGAMGWKPFA